MTKEPIKGKFLTLAQARALHEYMAGRPYNEVVALLKPLEECPELELRIEAPTIQPSEPLVSSPAIDIPHTVETLPQ